MAIKCVIHVGMPKCGSSALQTVLAMSPEFSGKKGERYSYVAIHPKGHLLSGSETLRQLALRNASGYVRSAPVKAMGELSSAHLSALRRQFAKLASSNIVPILSCEGWGPLYGVFSQKGWLEAMGLDCRVVFYVRPQVAWINSAWWQFGAWQTIPLRPWVERNLGDSVRWHEMLEGWKSVPGVSAAEARLLPPNIVQDFFLLLGAEVPNEVQSNVGLSGSVLRLFQRHRELRPLPHDSAIEFIIARHLKLKKTETPWVLDQQLVRDIIEQCGESNLQLLTQLDPQQKDRMESDAAWWSADYYSNRIVEMTGVLPIVADEADDLAAAAFKALFHLEEDFRALRMKYAQLQQKRSTGWRARLSSIIR